MNSDSRADARTGAPQAPAQTASAQTSPDQAAPAQPDPREIYSRALDQTATLIAAVRPDQLGQPTPCDAYDVRALLGHIVGGVHRAAHVGEGGNALDVPAHVYGVADDGWVDAFAEARARVVAAWADDAKLDMQVNVPWGKVPGRGALAGYIQEVLTHGWDLCTATGQPTELAADLARYALAVAERFLPEQPRGGPIPFGPVVAVPGDAGPYTRLAAWLGRTPTS